MTPLTKTDARVAAPVRLQAEHVRLAYGDRTVVDGLDHAVEAFIGMLSGANVGKMLVRVSDEQPGPD